MAEEYKAKIAALEAEISNRDTEIEGLRQAISKMPEFNKLDGDVCFKIPHNEQEEKVIIICDADDLTMLPSHGT